MKGKMMKRQYRTSKVSTKSNSPSMSYSTVYKCIKCRRAWQPIIENGNRVTEYFPSHISGDENLICPECLAKESVEA